MGLKAAQALLFHLSTSQSFHLSLQENIHNVCVLRIVNVLAIVNDNCFFFFQIDPGIIKIMPDEDLKKYIPAYGDRIAVKRFCNGTAGEVSSNKATLLQELKQKIKSR